MRDLILETFRRWLYIEDETALDVIVASALAIFFPGDPLWVLVVGSPGSGKTEFVRAFNGDNIYTLDTLTPRTLVSGLKDKDNPGKFGILPDLNGKLLVIKDLTVMLQTATNRPDENVFNQLRAAYDGEYAAAHGSGHKRQYYRSKFGVIAAVTPIVDRYRSLNSSLGERFLTVRMRPDITKSIKMAQENVGREDEMRLDLSNIIRLAIDFYKEQGQRDGLPVVLSTDRQKIASLGDLIARLRSEVDRDRNRFVTITPEPEVGTRLVKQLTRLAELLKLYGAYEYAKISRVALDCVHPIRSSILRVIYDEFRINAYNIHKKVGLSYPTVREQCEDLWMLGICTKETSGRNDFYSIVPDIMVLMIKAELYG